MGVRVVEALGRREWPDDVELLDGATSGLDLVSLVAGRRKVVVVDAVSVDAPPGTVVRLEPDRLGPIEVSVSAHDLGVREALAVARELGLAPAEVVILGVVPAEVDWGLELTPAVAAAVPRLLELAVAEVERSR